MTLGFFVFLVLHNLKSLNHHWVSYYFCFFTASCQVPAEDEVSFTDVNGQTIKANKTLPNGTILKIECIKKQGYKKQRTATCIAGKWSGPISHC